MWSFQAGTVDAEEPTAAVLGMLLSVVRCLAVTAAAVERLSEAGVVLALLWGIAATSTSGVALVAVHRQSAASLLISVSVAP